MKMSILKSSILERVFSSEKRWRNALNPAALNSFAAETSGNIKLQTQKYRQMNFYPAIK